MNKLEITIAERIAAMRLFDEFKGTLSQTAAILDDVRALAVKNDKWEKVNLRKTQNPDGSVTWNWDDEGSEENINMSPEGVSYLKDAVTKRSDNNEIGLADKALITLMSKLSNQTELKESPTHAK